MRPRAAAPVKVDPDSVRISEHAVRRFLLRYPHELLPRHPEREIRRLLAIAQPMAPRKARWYRLTLKPGTLMFTAQRWVFPLCPLRPGQEPWLYSLPTVLRDEQHANNVGSGRAERLHNWEAFRSGLAARKLAQLSNELRTREPHALRAEWYRRGMPLVLHGGYATWEEFYRSARRVIHAAQEEPVHE